MTTELFGTKLIITDSNGSLIWSCQSGKFFYAFFFFGKAIPGGKRSEMSDRQKQREKKVTTEKKNGSKQSWHGLPGNSYRNPISTQR